MITPSFKGLTVVIPSFNEAQAIGPTLTDLRAALARIKVPSEIIVVDDGSSDQTATLAASAGVRLIRHPVNSGYGRSILTGILAASHDTIAITDADGTYPVDQLPDLAAFYAQGFHMAVAARSGRFYDGSLIKRFLRAIFRWLAEYTCGRNIPDINSGFRIFDRRPVLRWTSSLSTGFSFTTTVTLLFMLNNLLVGYFPIPYNKRIGSSKVRMFRDSLRSLQIIVMAIAQFNPLKLFLLLALANVFGNIVIGTSLLYSCWDRDYTRLAAISWNTLSLLSALTILSLTLVRPASAVSEEPTSSSR